MSIITEAPALANGDRDVERRGSRDQSAEIADEVMTCHGRSTVITADPVRLRSNAPLGVAPGIGIDSQSPGGRTISVYQQQLFLDLGSGGAVPAVTAAPALGSARRPRARRGTGTILSDPETAALLLDGHDDFRVLRRLRPWSVTAPRALAPGERIAVIVDTETTGLDHRHDEVIEIGMVAFIHDAAGGVSEVFDVFNALQEPSRPIPPEITRLTGLDDAAVAGHRIDIAAVETFIEAADLVIAHNAQFDRPFCERLTRGFDPKPWGCSVREVDWAAHGYEGTKLGYLVNQSGWFHNGHRASDDCHALLAVLAQPLPGQERTALSHLIARSEATRVRIWADGAPFELKDELKRRGYRWDGGGEGRPRAWWVEVDETAADAEIAYLEQEIYMRRVRPRAHRITACDRYKAI